MTDQVAAGELNAMRPNLTWEQTVQKYRHQARVTARGSRLLMHHSDPTMGLISPWGLIQRNGSEITMTFSVQDNWFDFPSYRKQSIAWSKADKNDSQIVYEAMLGSEKWILRMNDFPDEPLYTLIINGVEKIHFNDWPSNWLK